MKDKQRNPAYKYNYLALVNTRDGMTYLGLHNNKFYNPKRGKITLRVVKNIDSDELSMLLAVTMAQMSRNIGAVETLKLPLEGIFTFMLQQENIPFHELIDGIEIKTNRIKDMKEFQEYHNIYHDRFVD